MSYYIFCDLIDEHTETFENENTFPEHLGAHRSDGSKAVNVWKLKPGDKFLFMKSGFSVIADGQVTDVKYLEDEDIFKVDYGINSWENEACLNDEEWREYLANVGFIKDKNVQQLKAYFRSTVRQITKEIYDELMESREPTKK